MTDPLATVDALAQSVRAGDRRALARAITLVESTRDDDRDAADALLARVLPSTGKAVRVGISGPPGPVERTYRIFVEELPPLATQSTPPGQVRVLARMGIPIFVTPRTAQPEQRMAGLTVQPGHVLLELRNGGTKHLVPQRIQVRGLAASGEAVWQRELEGWYILAGDHRVFDIPLPRDECLRTRSIAVEVLAGEPSLRERFDVAPQACGP